MTNTGMKNPLIDVGRGVKIRKYLKIAVGLQKPDSFCKDVLLLALLCF